MHARAFGVYLALMTATLTLKPPLRAALPASMSAGITISRSTYLGWADALVLSNGAVEAVVVPAIGRIMQFRFAGEADGPFWANPGLLGRQGDPAAKDWTNFGGDKAWPAPQEDWSRVAGRPWPPPGGFDGTPMAAESDATGVTLVSAVDPHYGIRVRRRIELTPGRPVMTIKTRFEKTAGAPIAVGVWTVTQAGDPVLVGAELAKAAGHGSAYVLSSRSPPAGLEVGQGLVTLTRGAGENTKIGLRAGTLVWVGTRDMLRIETTPVPGARYPEQGSSAQIYTNADPLPYVELEFFGPIAHLAAGDHPELKVVYTLLRRVSKDPAADLRTALQK